MLTTQDNLMRRKRTDVNRKIQTKWNLGIGRACCSFPSNSWLRLFKGLCVVNRCKEVRCCFLERGERITVLSLWAHGQFGPPHPCLPANPEYSKFLRRTVPRLSECLSKNTASPLLGKGPGNSFTVKNRGTIQFPPSETCPCYYCLSRKFVKAFLLSLCSVHACVFLEL